MKKVNNNIWDGKFKIKELELYPNLNQKDINLIMEYQKILPILNDISDNNKIIDGRNLYNQLKISTKTKFTDWIKNNLESIDAEKDRDFSVRFKTNGDLTQEEVINMSPQQRSAKGISEEYLITLETAKELVMVIGAMPRTNKETKHISKIARKYFITIEKAFKSRYEWNKDRLGSINQFKNLRKIIFTDLYGENRLGDFVPTWWKIVESKTGLQNSYAYELYKLDLIIIGKSAKRYREEINVPKGTLIRNTFNEKQLEEFELLQSKSAEYLTVNKVWNTDERVRLLTDWLKLHREGKIL